VSIKVLSAFSGMPWKIDALRRLRCSISDRER
jgi:hypothetical protein